MVALYLIETVHILFITYTIMIFLRIVSSWVPGWQHHHWLRFIAFYTDPYLNLFRRLLPPLGGMLDLSPILAFFALRILEMIIIALIR